MKVRLTKDRIISGKQFGKDSVVDLFQPEVEAIIAAGEGVAVPDGTMARKKAYGVPGCMPPAGFESNLQSVFAGLAVDIAQSEPTNEGTLPSGKQSKKQTH